MELYHHGIKGQRWGVRRFQNEDGTLTMAGKLQKYKMEKATAIQNLSEKKSRYSANGDFLERYGIETGEKMLTDKYYALKKTAATAAIATALAMPVSKFLANKAKQVTGKDYVSDVIKSISIGTVAGYTVGTGIVHVINKKNVAEAYSRKGGFNS